MTLWGQARRLCGEAWHGTGYLLVGLVTAAVTLLALPLLVVPVLARGWADWHRHRAGGAPDAPRTGTLRDLGWLPVHILAGGVLGAVAVLCVGNLLVGVAATPLWWVFPADDPLRLLLVVPVTSWSAALAVGPPQILAAGILTCWLVPLLARAHARLCLAVLSPSAAEQLARRVEVLAATRADVLDAHGAELRRIERDLHDGTQARLVAIAVRLGVARESLAHDPELVAKLLREAHEGTEDAMTELRDVIRTIYPPILADRGLTGAVTALAAHAGVPTSVDLGELGDVPAAVEAAAYFVVAEALTNAAKHAHATRAAVRLARSRGGRLTVEVTDDGTGGADETRGTGISGIRRRAAALDGTARISSPPGGPTTVTVEVPCGS